MKVIVLIAMLRTVNEGGAIQRDFTSMEDCLLFGEQLEQQFEGITLKNDTHPSVLWVCLDRD